MRQPEKFICISYPQIDFLIPNDYVISSVGVKDLNISPIPDLKKIFLTCIKEIMSDNKDSEVLKQYNELFKKKVELNYPLIDCIEKARLALYIYYYIIYF